MEVLHLDGVTFKKVSSAARDTGYTTDYIGQLCRSGKINARLVGRTWYVDADALSHHKRSNPRSNAAKTRQKLAESSLQVTSETERSVQVPMRVGGFPEYHKRLLSTEVKYEPDTTPLVPTLSADTPREIAVQKSIDIQSEEETPEEEEKPLEVPKMKWSGTIVVSEIPEEVQTEAEVPTVTPLNEVGAIDDGPLEAPKPSDHEPLPISKHFLSLKDEEEILGMTIVQPEVPAIYVSKVPMILTSAVLVSAMIFALFVEGVWVYEGGSPTRDPHFSSTFNVTSVSNVANIIMKK